MKNSAYLSIILSIILQSCYLEAPGPSGPVGPRGYDGQDGQDGHESFVFEYEFDFRAPEYRQLLLFPSTFQMFDSDVVLVYFLWEVTNDGVEVWRQLPQTIFTSDGTLVYNYDFSKLDVSVHMNATFPLQFLSGDYLNNWVARVVVVPGQFTNGRSETVDFSDYNAVEEYYGLNAPNNDRSSYIKKNL